MAKAESRLPVRAAVPHAV